MSEKTDTAEEVSEVLVVPAKASHDCYAVYSTVVNDQEVFFWLHHGPETENPVDQVIIDSGKSYKTALMAVKSAIKDAETNDGRGNPRAAAVLKAAATRMRKK